jgi:hypothetical protein
MDTHTPVVSNTSTPRPSSSALLDDWAADIHTPQEQQDSKELIDTGNEITLAPLPTEFNPAAEPLPSPGAINHGEDLLADDKEEQDTLKIDNSSTVAELPMNNREQDEDVVMDGEPEVEELEVGHDDNLRELLQSLQGKAGEEEEEGEIIASESFQPSTGTSSSRYSLLVKLISYRCSCLSIEFTVITSARTAN